MAPTRHEAVDQHPADHHQEYVRQTVDGIQCADLGVAEVQLARELLGDRSNRVVGVIIAEHDGGDGAVHERLSGEGGDAGTRREQLFLRGQLHQLEAIAERILYEHALTTLEPCVLAARVAARA